MQGVNHTLFESIPVNRQTFVTMPKIEVHRHLEGTYPIRPLFEMAQRNHLDVPNTLEEFKKAFQFPKDHEPDFLLFLSKFKKFWYKDLNDVATISYESVKSFAEENLFYIELRFNPLHFTELSGLDPNDVTRTIIESCNSAASETNLRIRYLLTFNRGVHTSEEMIQIYKELHDSDLSKVVGIDLAGDETNYPPELFTSFFDLVKKDGHFQIDIHAGEVSPDSKNIWVSIDQLHADRIGHGVAAIHDPKIQDVLKKKNIFLAQCITSNYQTGAWTNMATHPMKPLVDSGVPITIASDDPTIQDSDLTDDFILAATNFGWSVNDLIDLNLKGIDSTFLNPSDKTALAKLYLAAIEKYHLSLQ